MSTGTSRIPRRIVQEQPGSKRTIEDIEADMKALSEGMKKAVEDKKPESEEKVEEEVGEDLHLEYSLVSNISPDSDIEEYTDFINNAARRRKIESELGPINLDDLLLHGEITQSVPLLNGKINITFRTVTGEEDAGMKAAIDDLNGNNGRFLTDSYSMMATCIGVKSVGNKELPSCLNKEGDFDRSLFKERYKVFKKYPAVLIRDLVVNYIWFDRRVQKAVTVEALGKSS